MSHLAIVTASVDPDATREFWGSWRQHASLEWDLIMVLNSPGAGAGVAEVVMPGGAFVWVKHNALLGPVPAFYSGISQAILRGADIIACLHDDLRISEPGWDAKLITFLNANPSAGLVGFGGALGLGVEDIYQKRYEAFDLVRRDFISNMKDAELHGRRVEEPTRVACLDGFSQIGRAPALLKWFRHMKNLGVVHHAYDSALGAYFNADKWEVWMLPFACHHAGGRTAVANPKWQEHLAQKKSSDQAEWARSHELLYEDLRGKLPIRF